MSSFSKQMDELRELVDRHTENGRIRAKQAYRVGLIIGFLLGTPFGIGIMAAISRISA